MRLHSLYIFLMIFSINRISVQAQHNEKIFDNQIDQKKISSLYGYNQFKNKLPFKIESSLVTFFLRGNEAAKKVFLSGSFCDWAPDQISMEKNDSGWMTTVKLDPGKHLYKFIVDGNWENDTDNLLSEVNEHGTYNSIYYKTNIVFRLQGFSNTKKVFLAGSFNNWSATELPLSKTGLGWEIHLYLSNGSYLYKFKTDKGWLEDPRTPKKLTDKSGGFNSLIKVGGPIVNKNLAYYQNELAINERSGNKVNIIDNLINLGNGYMKTRDYTNAIKSFQKAKLSFEESKNYSRLGDILISIADAYRELSDFPRLLEYLQKARREYEKAGNKGGLAKTLRSTGYYYLNLSQDSTAVIYFQQSLALYKILGEQKEEAYLLGDLGHSYLLLHDSSKAISHLNQALSLNEKIENKLGMAKNLWIIGDYYFRTSSNISKTLDYFQKSVVLYEETNNKIGVAQVLINAADVYNQTPDSILEKVGIPAIEKYTRSLKNLKISLRIFKELLPESEQLWVLYLISDTYEKAGKFDSAHNYYKEYIGLREKIVNTDKQKEITRLETKYEYEKKQDSLSLQQELTNEKLQKQSLLSIQQQQELELSQSQLALSNKEKDLQHLAYLKTQADLKNEQLTKQQKEKENELQSTQLKSLTQKNAIIQFNQQRQWIYIIGGFLLLAVGSLYFIYRSRLHSVRLETQLVKEKAAQEKKESEFQHKLADISMSALRSQMNPHFIFNCLNSIKLYTTQNETVAATEYLTKFSKLIRLVLENSRNERITLSSELAALQLYIEMEAMRFKEKLSYSFKVEQDVETGYIEIPPLLLQPYVENAIWHGLMPKDEGGHIAINVSMQEHESLLEINIADNGIGREAATALNNKKSGKHHSYGMKATTERIQLINQIYKTGANVIVQDLVDDRGQAAGTQVTIQIPV